MKSKTIVVGFVAVGVALAGVLAYVMMDTGPGAASLAASAKGSNAGGVTGGGFFGGSSGAGGQGGTGLSPEQEALLRGALEKMGNDAAVRAALTADVPRPWPLPEAQKQLATCLDMVQQGLPTSRESAKAEICTCAVRAAQRDFPGAPPPPGTRRDKTMVEARFRAGLEECINGP